MSYYEDNRDAYLMGQQDYLSYKTRENLIAEYYQSEYEEWKQEQYRENYGKYGW